LSEAKPRTPWSIQKVFGLSRRAAEIALANYRAYDKSYHVQWHNDIVNLFGTQCKEVRVTTYQLDCWLITKEQTQTEAVPAQGQGNYISPYMMRKILLLVMRVRPPEPKVQITISPKLYERVVLDWI